MKEDVKMFVQSCEECQKRKIVPGDKKALPTKPIKAASHPFERIHVDIMGPLQRTENGNVYILMTVDAFSKYVIGTPMHNQEAITVSDCFLRDVLLKYGVAEEVITDGGGQFTGKIFEELSKLFGFRHNTSMPYHQKGNGQIEVINRIIANIVAQKGTMQWDQALPLAIFAYNTSVHSATGLSPFFIIHMKEARMPTDLLIKRMGSGITNESTWYTERMIQLAGCTWKIVKENIEKAQIEFKKRNDGLRKAQKRNFTLGNWYYC
jgi:hypothetical protein